MKKFGNVLIIGFERICIFIVLLACSPAWIIMGIVCAISALFGSFDSRDYYEEPNENVCPEEIDCMYPEEVKTDERIREEISELEDDSKAIHSSVSDC